jgi:hypothetical protein
LDTTLIIVYNPGKTNRRGRDEKHRGISQPLYKPDKGQEEQGEIF